MAREKERSGFWGIWGFLKWLLAAVVILAIFCITFGTVNLRKVRDE